MPPVASGWQSEHNDRVLRIVKLGRAANVAARRLSTQIHAPTDHPICRLGGLLARGRYRAVRGDSDGCRCTTIRTRNDVCVHGSGALPPPDSSGHDPDGPGLAPCTGLSCVIHRGARIAPLAGLSALSLATLLVALFPANIRAARVGIEIAGRPAMPLHLRVPLQLFWIACLLWIAMATGVGGLPR
jgi:hypothetical protein